MVDTRHPDTGHLDTGHLDNRHLDNRNLDNRHLDNRHLDNRHLDDRDLDDRDFDACYAAVRSRDRRFDGRFVTGVLSTGIFCRPSCPARTPKRSNVRFFPSPAAAQATGLRACRRCRPELAPDRPGHDPTAELANRALRLIDAGMADDVTSLAGQLHVSPRHLRRILTATYGAGPSALLTMRRVRLARMLVDQTDLPLSRVAFTAGFGSIRQFNAAFRDAFHATPTDLRRGRAAHGRHAIDLPVREPFHGGWILQWAALHAVPGRDQVTDHAWTRLTDVGPVTMEPAGDHLRITWPTTAEDVDLRPLVGLARQAFDLDADIDAVTAALAADKIIGPLMDTTPGLRIPGTADPWEGAVRVVLGQRVSATAATTLAGRLANLHDGLGMPPPAAFADLPLESTVGLTRQRADAIRGLAKAVCDGLDLGPSADAQATHEALLDLPGIGPWTAGTISLLVLRNPDAWPSGDLALRRAVTKLTGTPTSARDLDRIADRWRPWRGYAAIQLWHDHLTHDQNHNNSNHNQHNHNHNRPSVTPPGVLMHTVTVPTPAGPLTAIVEADTVLAAGFDSPTAIAGRLDLPQPPPAAIDHDVAKRLQAWVDGDLAALEQIPLAQPGTEFQQAVWTALAEIPPGQTASYGELAAAIGRPNAVRAVGAACGRNRIAPFIPCHRAVRSDGRLGGYAYGLAVKQWLLDHERGASLRS